jgi:aryl-alcohol dehydrogenase-like predicted oxidoreductase
MKQIILPNTNIKVSQLGFGTSSLHHLVFQKDREKLLSYALDLGFTHLDTAPLYGEGLAEHTLGNYLGLGRDKITIATKIGISSNPILRKFPALMYAQKTIDGFAYRFSKRTPVVHERSLNKKQVEDSLQYSLKALRTDWVDILFIHEPQTNDIFQLLDIVGWLQAQKKLGVVRYLGLAGQAQNCVEIAKKIPNVFDILQVEDSLNNHEADIVTSSGFPLQITFGYLRKSLESNPLIDPSEIIKESLQRNQNGMILVSSRNSERLKSIASLA